jgi:hypothetical protein
MSKTILIWKIGRQMMTLLTLTTIWQRFSSIFMFEMYGKLAVTVHCCNGLSRPDWPDGLLRADLFGKVQSPKMGTDRWAVKSWFIWQSPKSKMGTDRWAVKSWFIWQWCFIFMLYVCHRRRPKCNWHSRIKNTCCIQNEDEQDWNYFCKCQDHQVQGGKLLVVINKRRAASMFGKLWFFIFRELFHFPGNWSERLQLSAQCSVLWYSHIINQQSSFNHQGEKT